jgi:pheromone shutdown protein TraB
MKPGTAKAGVEAVAQEPPRWLDRLLGACLTILVGAAAISIAVHLIEAVWTSLVIILTAGGFIGLVVVLVRNRSRGW